MNSIAAYLALPPAYSAALGGLRWSSSDDAVVYADNMTFALNAEISLFLEGLHNVRSLVHFSYVLHLLDLLRPFPEGKRTQTPGTRQLYLAYREAGGSISNAGAFFGTILKDLPAYPGVTDLREISRVLREPLVPAHWFVSFYQLESGYEPEMPPLAPDAFEQRVLQAVQAYSMEELISWFRFGRGPTKDAAQDLVEQLIPEPPTRTLAGVLVQLLERPRLAPVQPLLAGLVSALSLPPRRLQEEHLPIGGYSDVTTHGQPAQILPSQLALDPLEFLRRFAERELLYFQREEPQRQIQEELVILLDQGVRTWGDVRLVLSAAALALMKRASHRHLPLRFAATSNDGALLDPLEASEEEVGELLETSDLTPHPAEALAAALAQPGELPRDVILLTHPRNLREAEVSAAARGVPGDTRLFALTLDAAGDANLWQCQHGQPIKIRHFRVDLGQLTPHAEEPPADTPSPPTNWTGWRGDVEPIPFPFTFGISGGIGATCFDFDYEGKWLLIASAPGMLHCWNLETKELEVLPRCLLGSEGEATLIRHVEQVVGVAAGFVILSSVEQDALLAHYDFNTRTCRGYRLSGCAKGEWAYLRGYHALGYRRADSVLALDLLTGEQHATNAPANPHSRAEAAWNYCRSNPWPNRWLTVHRSKSLNETQELDMIVVGLEQERVRRANSLTIDAAGERYCIISKGRTQREWQELPRVEGLPLLTHHQLRGVQLRGKTLAMRVGRETQSVNKQMDWQLYLIHEPDGKLLGQLPGVKAYGGFVLSSDGERIAWQSNRRDVQVNYLTPAEELATIRFNTFAGCFHQDLRLRFGDHWLGIEVSKNSYAHVLWWQEGSLQHACGTSGLDALCASLTDQRLEQAIEAHPGLRAIPIPDWLAYDRQRFTTAVRARATAVCDNRGQVSIFGADRELLCMLFVFRLNIQAWLPDGTRLNRNDLSAEPRHLPPATRESRARLVAALETASLKGTRP